MAVFAERGGDPDRPGKQDPLDCLVWRLQRPDEPGWDSPLGRGRPGWHIECTAIALNRLGSDFDVQAGGSDLIFPHHEMCASEARVATDQPFAQLYAHSGMVGLDGEKMSKSKGNLVLVSKLRAAGVDPMAIRLALLSQHYRDDWMWTDDILAAAVERLATWREAVRLDAGLNADATVAAVRAALADDLNAPPRWPPSTPGRAPRSPSTATTPTPPRWWPGPLTPCWVSGSGKSDGNVHLTPSDRRVARRVLHVRRTFPSPSRRAYASPDELTLARVPGSV